VTTVHARDTQKPGEEAPAAAPFQFDTEQLGPLQFSRVDDGEAAEPRIADRQTQFSFKLKPNRPDFTKDGAFGLNIFGRPEVAVQSGPLGPYRLTESVPDLHDGFAYSAGVKIEHEDADISGTAYVSSSLLGLSYGRLGRLWYGGIDVNLEQFSDEYHGEEHPDVVSLDLTTGRRLGWTGLSAKSPLWLLTLQGDFDVQEAVEKEELDASSAWFLNPSLFWQHPGFTFSAQVQVPMDNAPSDDAEDPDYRLRAVFEKLF